MATWTEYFIDPAGNYRTFRGLSEDDAINLSVQLQAQGYKVIQRVIESPGDKAALAGTPAAAEYVVSVADTVERARTAIPGALQSTAVQAADPNSPTVAGTGQTSTGAILFSSAGSSSKDPVAVALIPNQKRNLWLWGAIGLGLYLVFGE